MRTLHAQREGVLVVWRKQPGESVDPSDVICEIESDKGLFEQSVGRTLRGTMGEHLVSEGQPVRVNDPLCTFAEPGEQSAVHTAKPRKRRRFARVDDGEDEAQPAPSEE